MLGLLILTRWRGQKGMRARHPLRFPVPVAISHPARDADLQAQGMGGLKVILIFHVVGTAMEVFRRPAPAHGSILKTNFFGSAAFRCSQASCTLPSAPYMARSNRIFDIR